METNGDYSLVKHGSIPPRTMPDVLKNGASYISFGKKKILYILVVVQLKIFLKIELEMSAPRPFYYEKNRFVRPSRSPFYHTPVYFALKKFCPWRHKIIKINDLVGIPLCFICNAFSILTFL